MKHLSKIILVVLLVFTSCGKAQKAPKTSNEKVSTFYFIRHAEKDRSDTKNNNPHLLYTGNQRAERWKDILKNISFDAVYSTDYYRTKETAIPTAANNNLQLTLYNPKTIDISSFLKVNEGNNVLVVGHSNTTPQLVNRILKTEKYKDIEDSNNANLYIVTISGHAILDVLLYLN